MKPRRPCVLALNGGSSSIRFAVYEAGTKPRPCFTGKIDRIGARGARLVVDAPTAKSQLLPREAARSHEGAVNFLLTWLERLPAFASITAVGHRVVHGMKHTKPETITPRLLAELRRITPYDPEHLPKEIALIEAFRRRYPHLVHVACFDTAFHCGLPDVAKRLPIPRRFAAKGVERYGFHGLSYAYLMEELQRLEPRKTERVILAHLGSGASLAAVLRGRSFDTSMGFTPTGGLMMGTRTGDLDPGIMYFLERTEGMTAAKFQRMVNHEAGLLGVSGTSSDVRDLLARERRDVRAREALALFCYQAKKWIGAFTAALGGVDTIVFAGGIGENAPALRERICAGLDFLGLKIDEARNAKSAAVISTKASRVTVRVIHTNEEQMIARLVVRHLRRSGRRKTTL